MHLTQAISAWRGVLGILSGTLYSSQTIAINFRIGHPLIIYTGVRSSDVLQTFDYVASYHSINFLFHYLLRILIAPGQNGRYFAEDICICIFVNEKCCMLIRNTVVCSLWSNWQLPSIGLDKGLGPNRRQAIIWTSADPIHWRIYAAPGGDELSHNWWANGSVICVIHFQKLLYSTYLWSWISFIK